MPNLVNQMVVRELENELEGVGGMLIVSLHGLSMPENEELRTQLAEKGVRLRLVRNSLAKVALKSSGVDVPGEVFQGSCAIAYGSPEDAIHAAKVVSKSALVKEGKLAVRAGLLEGNVLAEGDAKALADVPDRDTLNAQLLGVISGPARGLATVIGATPSGLARVIQAHADQGGEGGESEA